MAFVVSFFMVKDVARTSRKEYVISRVLSFIRFY